MRWRAVAQELVVVPVRVIAVVVPIRHGRAEENAVADRPLIVLSAPGMQVGILLHLLAQQLIPVGPVFGALVRSRRRAGAAEVGSRPGHADAVICVGVQLPCLSEGMEVGGALVAWARRRTLERVGIRIEISTPMMPITTSSSTRVKPPPRVGRPTHPFLILPPITTWVPPRQARRRNTKRVLHTILTTALNAVQSQLLRGERMKN